MVTPGLDLFQVGICLSNEGIGCLVHLACRGELVTDRAFRTVGGGKGNLIFERIGVLVSPEFPPRLMELTCHTQKFHPQPLHIAGRQRKMVIAPAAGREGFQFQMCVGGRQVAAAFDDMPPVVEDRHIRLTAVDGFLHSVEVISINPFRQLVYMRLVVGVLPLGEQGFCTVGAVAVLHADNVQKDTVCVVVFHHLGDMLHQLIQVGRVEAEGMVAGMYKILHPGGGLVCIAQQPVGVVKRILLVQPGGYVNRRLDTDLMRRFYLGAQQVEREVGVRPVRLSRMVRPSMVAF